MVRSEDAGGWIEDFSQDREPSVYAPLTQANIELSVNWQSPFEGAGIESSFPGLAQMSQSGMFQGIEKAIGAKTGFDMTKIQESTQQLIGRSGVTKLNSTQVFSGMQPAKLQLTAYFRAMYDSYSEVEEQIRRLQMWAVPQKLAPDGVIATAVNDWQGLQSLMPSLVPKIIGVDYKNRSFFPFVIESISDPLDTPSDEDGNRISAVIQMTICSLTALDRTDWGATYKHRI